MTSRRWEPVPFYRDPAAARVAIRHARIAEEQMHRELSGCDWCCGGGDERLASLRHMAREAAAWLRERGEALPSLPPLCRECGYYDARNGDLCPRCQSVLRA